MRAVYGWLSLELVAITAPIVLAWRYGTGDPATFWSHLLVITGSQAAATLVVAVLFASRYKVITSSIGIDSAITLHRTLGSAAVLFSFAHLIGVIADYPFNAWFIDIFQAPARAVAGMSALMILLLMVFFANEKKENYEIWRWSHRLGAIAAAVFIGWHIVGVNQLVNSLPWLLFFLFLLLAALGLFVSRVIRTRRNYKFLVKEIQQETATASTMRLAPLGRGFSFSAGQFVWLRINRQVRSEDHPFTIASSEHSKELCITFRHIGNWTKGPLAEVRPGKIIRLDGPHGAMSLSHIPNDKNLALVGLGVGLTPVMSILRTLADEGSLRQIAVFINPTEDLFRVELELLEAQLPNMKLYPIVIRPITWRTFGEIIHDPSEWIFLVCGPSSMVNDAKDALRRLQTPENNILTEQFEII